MNHIINLKKLFIMEKIIVSMANSDAIEVRENQRLAPRYGDGTHSTFPELKEKEQKVIQQCEKIIKESCFPPLIQKLVDFGVFEQERDKDAKLTDFFVVLQKAKELLDEDFRALIVIEMLGCATGHKSQLGYGEFNAKFSKAFIDTEVRKDFWGTEYFLPIDLVRMLLIDLMSQVHFDDLGAENIKKSRLAHYYLFINPRKKAVKIGDFIEFCNS